MAQNERWEGAELTAHRPLSYRGPGRGTGWVTDSKARVSSGLRAGRARGGVPSTTASRDAPGCLVTDLKSEVPVDLWPSSPPSQRYE